MKYFICPIFSITIVTRLGFRFTFRFKGYKLNIYLGFDLFRHGYIDNFMKLGLDDHISVFHLFLNVLVDENIECIKWNRTYRKPIQLNGLAKDGFFPI